jgi:ABC-type bacteriocin/lantibiotic exporter with double-glycine peptidase domain
VLSYLEYIYEFFTSGIYEFVVDLTAYILTLLGVLYISWKITLVIFVFDVAYNILEIFQLKELINSFLSHIDSRIANYMAYLRIIDGLIVMVTAKLTRYILNLVGM